MKGFLITGLIKVNKELKMKNIIPILLLTILCFFLPNKASAELRLLGAENVYNICKDFSYKNANTEGVMCLAYIKGLYEGNWYVNAYNKINKMDYPEKFNGCIPSNRVTYPQIIKIYVKYLDDNPKYLSGVASQEFDNAMKEAFPCEQE